MMTAILNRFPRTAYRIFWMALLTLGVLSVLSCSQQTKEQRTPAPSSSLTMEQAEAYGFWWVLNRPDHGVFKVEPTGSMLPLLGSNSLLLAERFTGQVNVNDICIYDHDPKLPAVCHRVVAIDTKNKAVIFEGDNNPIGPQGQSSSDGWIDMSRINYRVAGILYTERTP